MKGVKYEVKHGSLVKIRGSNQIERKERKRG